MKPRAQRALSLLGELDRLGGQLGDATPPRSAVLFIDRLERCRGYLDEDLSSVDLSAALAPLERRSEALGEHLGEAAGQGFDLDRIWRHGLALAEGSSDPDAWAEELLLLANVAPHIPGARGKRACETVDRCLALASSAPMRFLPVGDAAVERTTLEAIHQLEPRAREAHQRLEGLAMAGVVDRGAPAVAEGHLRALLDPIRSGLVLDARLDELPDRDEPWAFAVQAASSATRAPNGRSAPPSGWKRFLERANDSLRDASSWKAGLHDLLWGGNAANAQLGHALSNERMVRLGQGAGEDWWLVRGADGLAIQASLEVPVVVTARYQDRTHKLGQVNTGTALRWALPDVAGWRNGLELIIEVGPDSFDFLLPGAQAEE